MGSNFINSSIDFFSDKSKSTELRASLKTPSAYFFSNGTTQMLLERLCNFFVFTPIFDNSLIINIQSASDIFIYPFFSFKKKGKTLQFLQ